MGAVTRTIEPGISVFSAAEIKVAFVQIGPIPKDVYEEYLEAFNKHRHVPLHAVRALHQEVQKSPFGHTPWRTGALHLRFLPDDDARRRTRIADLHAQRPVLAVIGVVHCPLVEDMAAAHAEFGRVARQYPDALVTRCCAFDPADHHLQAASRGMRDLMMFPAGSPSHLEQHIQVYTHELGAALLAETENWVLTAGVANVKLNTHVDSAEFTGSLAHIQEGLQKLNINEEEVREKKRWGRLQKTKGDLALISGSPRDAFEHYRSGMELSKVSGDTVWTAAALEGQAHARVMEALSSAGARGGEGGPNALKRSLALSAPAATAAAAATAASASPRAASPRPVLAAAEAGPGAGAPPAAAESSGSSVEAAPPAAWSGAAGGDAAPPTPAAAAPAAVSLPRAASAPLSPQPPASPRPPKSPQKGVKGPAAPAPAAAVCGALTNASMWSALRSPGLQEEVKELLDEARAWYRKKGGALALQIESSLKLARFLAGVCGPRAARPEGLELMGYVLEAVPQLSLLEDRLVALVEVAQVMGILGCSRKRQLLLWAAVDLSHAVDRSDTLALRIATKALEPPDDHEAQDPDDCPRRHWSQRRAPLPLFDPVRAPPGSCWEVVQLAAAEAALAAARQANSPIEAWEAASLLIREHNAVLPQPYQASLMEALAQAAARFPQRALLRRGAGPGPPAQLRRIVPPAPALAPLRLAAAPGAASMRRSDGPAGGAGGGSAGPFIFNPYAAKREQGEAAAAAESAVMEWVAGDECRAEVMLLNPFLLPLKIDQLALSVEAARDEAGKDSSGGGGETVETVGVDSAAAGQPQQQRRQRQDSLDGDRGKAGGAGAGDGAGSPAVTVSPVSVTLPAGGKPIKVVLSLVPHRPGDLMIKGVRVTCWGVTWHQPLTLLPHLGPLTAPGALRPQAPQLVHVLPQLPLLRATLAGQDMQLVQHPQDGDGRGGAAAAAAAAGQQASQATAGAAGAAAAAAAAAASSGVGGMGKAASVPVFEGQHLVWTLTLANVSDLVVGGCSLSVANAKGQPVRPLPQGAQLPASFVGVHVEAAGADAALRAALPLEPRRSVSLPLSLVVGRPPADSFEEVLLELRITYTAPAPPATEGGAAAPEIIGRRLSVPLRFVIQPTLTVTTIRFLQLGVPLRDGARYASPAINLRDAGLTRDASLYRCVTGRPGSGPGGGGGGGAGGGGGLVRNSSEGALPSPSMLGALARQQHQRLRWQEAEEAERQRQEQQQQRVRQLRQPGGGGGDEGDNSGGGEQESDGADTTEVAAAGGGGSAVVAAAAAGRPPVSFLCQTTDCVIELGVRNCSERYFRTWLSRLPGKAGADAAESAVVVLEPGDNVRLLCPLLPPAPAPAPAPAPSQHQQPQPPRPPSPQRPPAVGCRVAPVRMQCAERLVESLGVMWEMITGDVAPDKLPRGLVRLVPVDVAHSLSPAAVAALCPSQLHARLVALPGPGSCCPPALSDVTQAAHVMGAAITGAVGQTWAVRLQAGQPLLVELRLFNNGSEDETLQLSITATDLVGAAAGAGGVAGGSADGGARQSQEAGPQGGPGGAGGGGGRASGGGGAAAGRQDVQGGTVSSRQLMGGGAAEPSDGGLLLTGGCERAVLSVPGRGGSATHRLSVLPLKPGLYQLGVVEASLLVRRGGTGAPAGGAVYLTQDRLCIMVT